MNTGNWTIRRTALQQRISMVLVILASCFAAGELTAKPPTAADFPELATNLAPFDAYICSNSMTVDGAVVFESATSKNASSLIPADSRIVAFEENSRFLYTVAQAAKSPTVVRRVILIKPSVLIVDDSVGELAAGKTLRWQWSCRDASTGAAGGLLLSNTGGKCAVKTAWSADGVPTWTVEKKAKALDMCCLAVKPKPGENAVRRINVFSIHENEKGVAAIAKKIRNRDGVFDVEITAEGNVYQFELPSPKADAGQIEIKTTDGKVTLQRRPLPSGVLPHGPEGTKLLERWDGYYRNGRRPPWNNDMPAAPVLQEAIEKKTIKPCRVAVLGCGSGSNAIYLAKNGFDVTAIDVAPTALGIAQADAKKAGVKVRWMLADVLALPQDKPYDLIFDRGCYHNVRYVDAEGFVASVKQLCRPGTGVFLLSCNRDKAPGIREKTMRDDFTQAFDFEWIRKATIYVGKDGTRKIDAWSVMLRRKKEK
jgi:SAM-dependent methyltransferase